MLRRRARRSWVLHQRFEVHWCGAGNAASAAQRNATGPAGPSVNIGWAWIRCVLLDGTSALLRIHWLFCAVASCSCQRRGLARRLPNFSHQYLIVVVTPQGCQGTASCLYWICAGFQYNVRAGMAALGLLHCFR